MGVPRPHIPFHPDLILYVNLVAMGPVHLSPVTWPQALRYWYSLTPLMHIVAQLRPIHLGQTPESSQFLGASTSVFGCQHTVFGCQYVNFWVPVFSFWVPVVSFWVPVKFYSCQRKIRLYFTMYADMFKFKEDRLCKNSYIF